MIVALSNIGDLTAVVNSPTQDEENYHGIAARIM